MNEIINNIIALILAFVFGYQFRELFYYRELSPVYNKKKIDSYKELKVGDLIECNYYKDRVIGVVIRRGESKVLTVRSFIIGSNSIPEIDMRGDELELIVNPSLTNIYLLINFDG